MARKVEVVAYDFRWPGLFETEAGKLETVLGENLIAIHHIGSTSVPGLMAKPTVDLLVVVRSHEQLDACDNTMRALGYQSKGENGIQGRRYYQKLDGESHLYHIHAFESGHFEIARHLNFRDYLRMHPDEARAYQDLKVDLAAQYPSDPERYTSSKTDFIQEIDRRAATWREAGNGK